METIKSVEELPDWFRLSDYDVCDTFTAKEWGTQLDSRLPERSTARLMQYLRKSSPLKLIEPLREAGVVAFEDFAQAALKRIVEPQARKPRDRRRLSFEKQSLYFSPKGGGMNINGCVRPALYQTIAMTLKDASTSQIVQKKTLPLISDLDLVFFPPWYRMAFDEIDDNPSFNEQRATLEVDLSAPDSVLVEQFKEVVGKYRKIRNQKPPSKKASEKSIQKLRQYKVLAYLDLTHWAALTETQIHAAVLDKALFPNSYRGERFINETLKPWAESAMQPGFINTLLTEK